MTLTPPTPPGAWRYALHLPPGPRTPRVARAHVRTICAEHDLAQLADSAELLTSELVTNAIVHTAGPTCVRAKWENGRLRCTVTDADPAPPLFSAPAPTDESGRGLELLRAIASDWGHIPLGDGYLGTRGKAIWFELEP